MHSARKNTENVEMLTRRKEQRISKTKLQYKEALLLNTRKNVDQMTYEAVHTRD